MKYLSFTKMVAAGNDFIIVDNRRGILRGGLSALARRLLDKIYAIGADGLVLLERSKKADIRMRIFNPDGSEAEMCGNGVRCLAKFAVDFRITPSALSIETKAGFIDARVRGNLVRARMASPKDFRPNTRIDSNGKSHIFHFINTGVPHAVEFLKSLEGCDVKGTGRVVRFHPHFAPRGTNVDFVSLRPKNTIQIRTYERGVEDETLACGTGSTAAALVAAKLKNFKSPVRLITRSGETLRVYFKKNSTGFSNVYLEGIVRSCFDGRIRQEVAG